MPKFLCLFFTLFIVSPALAQRIAIQWPTPGNDWAQGRGYEAWVQPTVSGQAESGLYGCVRTNGTQFHEGIDIHPEARNSRGEPTDKVFAAMSGVVRHVNPKAGDSNYGRYIVIEHPDLTPAVYTLYAHLATIEPGLKAGSRVERGDVLAVMGNTGGGGTIPRDRAHLHFEIGVMVTQNFQSWYNWKKFGSPNEHGLWNGMNLMGIDPLDFLQQWRAKKVDNFQEYFDQFKSVVKVRIATRRTPDFITRYPSLLTKPMPLGLVAGWEVDCNATGVPFAWKPLTAAEVGDMKPNAVKIISAEPTVLRAYRCKKLVTRKGSGYVPAASLTTVLQQVFTLR